MIFRIQPTNFPAKPTFYATARGLAQPQPNGAGHCLEVQIENSLTQIKNSLTLHDAFRERYA
jgi:hypothetical protein